MYRTQFLGQTFTLRGLAWLALLARIKGRAIRQLLKAPALVVTFDERGAGGAHPGEISKDPTVDRLLLASADGLRFGPVAVCTTLEGIRRPSLRELVRRNRLWRPKGHGTVQESLPTFTFMVKDLASREAGQKRHGCPRSR